MNLVGTPGVVKPIPVRPNGLGRGAASGMKANALHVLLLVPWGAGVDRWVEVVLASVREPVIHSGAGPLLVNVARPHEVNVKVDVAALRLDHALSDNATATRAMVVVDLHGASKAAALFVNESNGNEAAPPTQHGLSAKTGGTLDVVAQKARARMLAHAFFVVADGLEGVQWHPRLEPFQRLLDKEVVILCLIELWKRLALELASIMGTLHRIKAVPGANVKPIARFAQIQLVLQQLAVTPLRIPVKITALEQPKLPI